MKITDVKFSITKSQLQGYLDSRSDDEVFILEELSEIFGMTQENIWNRTKHLPHEYSFRISRKVYYGNPNAIKNLRRKFENI